VFYLINFPKKVYQKRFINIVKAKKSTQIILRVKKRINETNLWS